MKPQILTPDQAAHFLDRGFVVLPQAFSPDVASEWTDRAYFRLGYDRHDPTTWNVPRIHMPQTKTVDIAEFAPNIWAAECELVGGESRVAGPSRWGDAFIFNFGIGRDLPWQPPSPATKGWHKDGDWFRHFLDSPEQGLLSIVCWTDMLHQGGGTFIAPDSVGVVARYLAAHPEGILPGDPGWRSLIGQCHDFVELTARAGDVVLLHPFMLHASSQNVLGVERAVTNPPVYLKEPMNFNRSDPTDFSVVELAVLKGLGVERFDFRPTSPRENIVPERDRIQAKLLEEEKARLAGAAVGDRGAEKLSENPYP